MSAGNKKRLNRHKFNQDDSLLPAIRWPGSQFHPWHGGQGKDDLVYGTRSTASWGPQTGDSGHSHLLVRQTEVHR